MGLILDTSILIAVERGRFDYKSFLQSQADEPVYVAAITAAELWFGVELADTPEHRHRRAAMIERHLSDLAVLDFDFAVARHHARLWAALRDGGNLIGAHDLQIAATALCHQFSLATLNHDEFARVPALPLVPTTPFVRS